MASSMWLQNYLEVLFLMLIILLIWASWYKSLLICYLQVKLLCICIHSEISRDFLNQITQFTLMIINKSKIFFYNGTQSYLSFASLVYPLKYDSLATQYRSPITAAASVDIFKGKIRSPCTIEYCIIFYICRVSQIIRELDQNFISVLFLCESSLYITF